MQSPGYEKPAVEKIKVYRWSRENTAKTQAVVNELAEGLASLIVVTGSNAPIVETLNRAIRRFKAIDSMIVLPGEYEG